MKSQNQVLLLGLDFGSTTSSAIILAANISTNAIPGLTEFATAKVIYRAEAVFTPFIGTSIDIHKIHLLIQEWLTESKIKVSDLFAASAIITGLAAQQENVEATRQLVLQYIPNAAVVAADDPHLESWLAFMGSCAALSRYHQPLKILNFDIGGGTANTALGLNGNVIATGCHFIGARHFKFVPSSYQVLAISRYGTALLQELNINKTIGDTLTPHDCALIIQFYIQALEAIALGNTNFFIASIAQIHTQANLKNHTQIESSISDNLIITFTGGVGELVYQIMASGNHPATTCYGDFGIDLALAITGSAILSTHLKTHTPENLGRATVYGLALNSTEVSGSSLYCPIPSLLPLRDLPILAKLPLDAPTESWYAAVTLASTRKNGACLQITQQENSQSPTLNEIRRFAEILSTAVALTNFKQTLVLLINGNIGKTLGNYITHWGKLDLQLIVIDEVTIRDANFVNLGQLQQGVVPVSFYGMYQR